MAGARQWARLACVKRDLRLDITLKCGQSFRWRRLEDGAGAEGLECGAGAGADCPVYAGVLEGRLLLLAQTESHLLYNCVAGSAAGLEPVLRDYFQLAVDLPALYLQWAQQDPIFERISQSYPGVRMLRQNPTENLFSFICSANNNISRISGMVERLCTEFGPLVGEFQSVPYHAFPGLERLAEPAVEPRLRELGFGYRAKYIQQAAEQILARGGLAWLLSHRTMDYSTAKQSLTQLSGVGPKVADCVLLMSLDQRGAVPVDTHMFTIAKQYLPHLASQKTVTTRVYTEIGDHFRGLYGEFAGWAHSVLFSADLKHLRTVETKVEVNSKTVKKKKDKQDVTPKPSKLKDIKNVKLNEKLKIKREKDKKFSPVRTTRKRAKLK